MFCVLSWPCNFTKILAATDPNVALPDNWEFVNVEVIPFEEAGI
jgi:hypothetical protein